MAIVLKHVSFHYGNKMILNDLSLTLPDSGFVVLLGKSGEGKTTFLNLLNGHILPEQGSIEISKDDIANVYQSPLLLPYLTVEENIALPLLLQGEDFSEAIEKTKPYLNLLQLDSLSMKYPFNLSGGEQVRVSIARALIKNNSTIILDEPTGQLDEKNSENIYHILKKLSLDHLVLLVTHDEINGIKLADVLLKFSAFKIITIKGEASPSKRKNHPKRTESKLSLKNAFMLNMKYLMKKRLRVIFSTLFMAFNLILIFLGLNLNSHVDENISRLLNEYYDSDVIAISMKEKVAKQGVLMLEKDSRPSDEMLSMLNISNPAPKLTHFIPNMYECLINHKKISFKLSPTIAQHQEKLQAGKTIDNYYEVVVNESFIQSADLDLSQTLNMTIPFSRTVLIYSTQFVDTDFFQLDINLKIVGISKEKKAFNQPIIYYSYPLMVEHLKTFNLPHISSFFDSKKTPYDFFVDPNYKKDDIQGNGILCSSKDISLLEKAGNYYFKDQIKITSNAIEVKKSTLEIISSLLSVLGVFLALNTLSGILLEFISIYSLYEENIKTFALIKSFTRKKENIIIHAFGLQGIIFGSLLLLLTFFSLLLPIIINHILYIFCYPPFLANIDVISFLIVFLIAILTSLFGGLLPLFKIKDSQISKELEGED